MLTTLIIFYSSLALIATMVMFKRLEQLGRARVWAGFNAFAEPVIKKIIADAKSAWHIHLNIYKVKLLMIAALRAMEKFLLSAQVKIRRWSETLTRKVRYDKLNKPKGATSFFLKDITDYKNHLPRKEILPE